MIAAGDTTGVFQLESSGFKELLKKLKPDCFEDIIAAGALYRPGPLEGGMVDDFIDRKHGRTKVTYPHPALEPILKDTYGVIVYQEQVMQISSALAGYSLGQADLLRRAMGKKKKEVDGEGEGQVPRRAPRRRRSTSRSPTRSSSSCRSSPPTASTSRTRRRTASSPIRRRTSSSYFPEEFLAGLLTCDKEDTDKVVKNVAEVRASGIEVLRPDVNLSLHDFSVVREKAKQEGHSLRPVGGQGRGRGRRREHRRGAREGRRASRTSSTSACASI